MTPEQELIEGVKIAAGSGLFIGLVAIGLVLGSAFGG